MRHSRPSAMTISSSNCRQGATGWRRSSKAGPARVRGPRPRAAPRGPLEDVAAYPCRGRPRRRCARPRIAYRRTAEPPGTGGLLGAAAPRMGRLHPLTSKAALQPPTVVSVSAATTLEQPTAPAPGPRSPNRTERGSASPCGPAHGRRPPTRALLRRIGLLALPRDEFSNGPPALRAPRMTGAVVFITRLRVTAMPVREIRGVLPPGRGRAEQRGPAPRSARGPPDGQVRARIADLESALGVIEFKIATYGGTASRSSRPAAVADVTPPLPIRRNHA